MTSPTRVLGVLNVTPDSFSDGGRFASVDAAIARGSALVAQGADIVDIGGESTRPGATPVGRSDELARTIPVIAALSQRGHRVSIDTLHSETAAEAVRAGARIINDVSGGEHDPAMLRVAADASRGHGVHYLIGHWRGIPDPEHLRSDYDDVVREVRDALAERARAAVTAGVDPAHIVIDPGLGFDKTGTQGWQLLAHLNVLAETGYPVLVGASRKRMIAEALLPAHDAGLPVAPEDRDLATSVVSALSALAGAWGVRVHDVPSTVQALAIARAWQSGAELGPGRSDRWDDAPRQTGGAL